jgi:hypothetical protein
MSNVFCDIFPRLYGIFDFGCDEYVTSFGFFNESNSFSRISPIE